MLGSPSRRLATGSISLPRFAAVMPPHRADREVAQRFARAVADGSPPVTRRLRHRRREVRARAGASGRLVVLDDPAGEPRQSWAAIAATSTVRAGAGRAASAEVGEVEPAAASSRGWRGRGPGAFAVGAEAGDERGRVAANGGWSGRPGAPGLRGGCGEGVILEGATDRRSSATPPCCRRRPAAGRLVCGAWPPRSLDGASWPLSPRCGRRSVEVNHRDAADVDRRRADADLCVAQEGGPASSA